jgi:hypothetical protein
MGNISYAYGSLIKKPQEKRREEKRREEKRKLWMPRRR